MEVLCGFMARDPLLPPGEIPAHFPRGKFHRAKKNPPPVKGGGSVGGVRALSLHRLELVKAGGGQPLGPLHATILGGLFAKRQPLERSGGRVIR